ncbi:MAG: ATP-binding cassette domain-containing protein [Actinobacteria bacterium]|nr:ATP-binding cassette domain-containing protein [Actinomycetota bacterium]
MEDNTIIEVKNLIKKFNGITAVNDISFTVKENEIFGFLGPNGAGKTTTINIICTLLSPNSGTVKLCNYDVTREKNKIRNNIGLVFQDPTLDDRLTAMENLMFHALLYNVPRKHIKSRIDEVLEMVDLSKRRNDLVRTFSGGMRRRLEIARGLIHYPRVLFLDEPTIGLDPQTRNKIWEYITMLKYSQNITIFLTTHYIEESEICDRIAIIDEGKIIALDSPEALKKMVGLDIITINSEDNEKLKLYLEDKIGKKIEITGNREIRFDIKDSSKFIPEFIRKCPVKIISINAGRATLNDVFLSLTGKEIREETAGNKDMLRMHMKGRMRR